MNDEMKPGFDGAVLAGAVNTPEEYEAWKVEPTPVVIDDLDFLAALDEGDYSAEDFEDYVSDSFYSQVRSAGDALRDVMADQQGGYDTAILVGFVCDTEGAIDGADVSMSIPGEWSTYLGKYVENKHLTDDRLATGKESALAIKSALLDAYNDIRSFAEKKGLIP